MQNSKIKGVHIVVKNNILLTVLLAAFTAPVFAIPNIMPSNQDEVVKVAVVAAGIEALSSYLTNSVPKAVEVTGKKNNLSRAKKSLSDHVSLNLTPEEKAQLQATEDAVLQAANAALAQLGDIDSGFWASVRYYLKGIKFTINGQALDFEGAATVNVVPAAAKIAAAMAIGKVWSNASKGAAATPKGK